MRGVSLRMHGPDLPTLLLDKTEDEGFYSYMDSLGETLLHFAIRDGIFPGRTGCQTCCSEFARQTSTPETGAAQDWELCFPLTAALLQSTGILEGRIMASFSKEASCRHCRTHRED